MFTLEDLVEGDVFVLTWWLNTPVTRHYAVVSKTEDELHLIRLEAETGSAYSRIDLLTMQELLSSRDVRMTRVYKGNEVIDIYDDGF